MWGREVKEPDKQDSCRPEALLQLAWGVFLFSMVYFFCVTFIPIPETGEDNAKYIVGFLVGTGVGSVISYYFRRNTDTPVRPPRVTDRPEQKD
jgi:hypothetical protein